MPYKGRRPKTTLIIKQIKNLKARGWTYREIGKRFGFSYQYAQMLIRPEGPRSGTCEICRSNKNLGWHHDEYNDENNKIRTLCGSCHRKIHANNLDNKFLSVGRKMTVSEAVKITGIKRSRARYILKRLNIYEPSRRLPDYDYSLIDWSLPPFLNEFLHGIPAIAIVRYRKLNKLKKSFLPAWRRITHAQCVKLGMSIQAMGVDTTLKKYINGPT